MDLQLYFGALVLFMVILFIHYLWVTITYLNILDKNDPEESNGSIVTHGVLLISLTVWFIVMLSSTVKYILQL